MFGLFKGLKQGAILAGVQAELIGQVNNQKFVSKVCQHPLNMEFIDEFKSEKPIYGKAFNFISVCYFLSNILDSSDFYVNEKKLALELLEDRFSRVFGSEFEVVFSSDLEKVKKKVRIYKSSLSGERANRQSALRPGEVSGDKIGCYLFGFTIDGEREPSYHSLAITKVKLIEDILSFLAELEVDVRGRGYFHPGNKEALENINYIRYNLDGLIDNHLNNLKDNGIYFTSMLSMNLFLHYGVRDRQKHRGEYIE
jgi:hypothetical protein